MSFFRIVLAFLFLAQIARGTAFDVYFQARNAANVPVQYTIAPIAGGVFGVTAGKVPTTYAASVFGRAWLNTADAAAGRTALALGTLATQSGVFSGTSSGTNTGDQTTVSGNAGSATVLETARTINGVSFNGSAPITVPAAGSTLTDTVPVAKGGTGLTALGTALYHLRVNGAGTALEYASSAGGGGDLLAANNLSELTATAATVRANLGFGTLATQNGTFSGTSSGTNTGDQTTITGNAGSATILATGRAINGVSFDGSAPITVTAAAGTLTGATLAAGVTASSLTSAAGGSFGTAAFTPTTNYTASNGAITGATKTKITFDTKGLVTAGADATTADIADSLNKRYVTDAHLTLLAATSGANTGDQTTITGNAGSATVLQTTRAINGVNFNGSAPITVPAAGSTLTDTVPVAKGGTGLTAMGTGLQFLRVNTGATALEYATLGSLATQSGTFSGTSSGTNTGDQTTVSGNAGSATVLQTGRTINGVSFNGSSNINVPRTGVVREFWIPAGAMIASATAGATAGTYTPSGTDVMTVDSYDFDDTAAQSTKYLMAFPDAWDLGTIKVKFFWASASGTGNVAWGVTAGATSDGDTFGARFGTRVAVVDTVIASDDLQVTSATAAVTVGSTPVLGDTVLFKFDRDPTTGTNKTGNARLLGVKVQYTESTTEPTAW